MKREGQLFEKIADYENLLWAYWKAKRGKNGKSEVLKFGSNIEKNIKLLQANILDENLIIGDYHYFKIFEPKERLICAASFKERVLHHAIMNVCHHNFESFQVFDSYATRIGKGTYAAIDRAIFFQEKYAYYMKIDCKKYFDSIDHNVLKGQLHRRFKDKKLLKLFSIIIDSYEVSPNKGLPIGNLTSQYFANHYLAYSDRYLSESLQIPAMVRYMDDILLWHNDSSALKDIGRKLATYCKDVLQIEFKHLYQNKTTAGVSFLGIFLWKKHQTLSHRSKKNLILNYMTTENKYFQNLINESIYHKKLSSLMVRPLKVKSYEFRTQLIWNINDRKDPARR